MSTLFEFDPEKSLGSAAYLADRTGETMYTVLKMIYVADRVHLSRYGKPITGDDFFALKEGACPSKIYDSMKCLRGEDEINYMPGSENILNVNPKTHDITVLDMPSVDMLSASEIECLDETVSILKRMGRWHIRDLAHDSAWEATPRNDEMDFVGIAQSIENGGDTLAEHIVSRFDS